MSARTASRSACRRCSSAFSSNTPALCVVKIGSVMPKFARQPTPNSGSASNVTPPPMPASGFCIALRQIHARVLLVDPAIEHLQVRVGLIG